MSSFEAACLLRPVRILRRRAPQPPRKPSARPEAKITHDPAAQELNRLLAAAQDAVDARIIADRRAGLSGLSREKARRCHASLSISAMPIQR